MTKNYGEAYAFFDCSASKEEIKRELPNISRAVRAPSKLELELKLTKDFIAEPETDFSSSVSKQELVAGIQNPENSIYAKFPQSAKHLMPGEPKKMSDLKYVLRARCQGYTGQRVQNQLDNIMNGVYTEFDKGRPFYVAVSAW